MSLKNENLLERGSDFVFGRLTLETLRLAKVLNRAMPDEKVDEWSWP